MHSQCDLVYKNDQLELHLLSLFKKIYQKNSPYVSQMVIAIYNAK